MDIEERAKDSLEYLGLIAHEMQFPEYLEEIRNCYRRSRRSVCKDMMFSEFRLFCLENGTVRKPIPDHEIELIAYYYKIDKGLLKKKAKEFIESGLGKPQSNKVKRR